jgi:hypothetical protein
MSIKLNYLLEVLERFRLAVKFFDSVRDFIGVVGEVNQIEIVLFDVVMSENGIFHPIEEAFPIFLSDEVDGEVFDFACLDEGQRFE